MLVSEGDCFWLEVILEKEDALDFSGSLRVWEVRGRARSVLVKAGNGLVVRRPVVKVGPMVTGSGVDSRQFDPKLSLGKVLFWNLDLGGVQVIGVGLGAHGEGAEGQKGGCLDERDHPAHCLGF